MTKYGHSPWLDRFPKSLVPAYPRHRGRAFTDVVIVGGGLTGCTAAYVFAVAGIRVVLIEAEQIGRGGTAKGSGWVNDDPGVSFRTLENALGLKAARLGWQTWRRAGLDFAALLRRVGVRSSLLSTSGITIAVDQGQADRLRREQKARGAAGLDAPWLASKNVREEARVEALGGIRRKEGAILDPYRAAVGLAHAATTRGARVFEHSPVTRIEFGRRRADLYTSAGSIRTARVVVATGAPTSLFAALRCHFWFRHTYAALTAPVPAPVRRRLGPVNLVLRDSAGPPHVVRWVGDDRLLVTGADAAAPPGRLLDRVIVQRTGQLMYELSTLYPDMSGIQPDYGWAAPYAVTRDGLPFIGPHRNYPHHLFAFGDASHGVTGAYLASRVLLRHHLAQVEPADQVFQFR